MFRKPNDSFFETGLIIFFLGVISLPLLKMVTKPDLNNWSMTEKRTLASMPDVPRNLSSLFDFPHRFEAYYNDHFGFREQLVYRYQREMKKRFGKLDSPMVIEGQNGWLFFTGNMLLQDFLGEIPLTRHELEDWLSEQERKEKWLQARGIRYLLVIAPNKQSIYQEYLPESLKSSKGTTRYEQLENYLNGQFPSYILSSHKVLHDSKKNARLYDKTDTHWNLLGGFLACNQIIDRLKQWYPTEKFKLDFTFQNKLTKEKGGDLANMLMMQDRMTEKRPILNDYQKCAEDLPFDRIYEGPRTRGCSSAHLKAVVFHDSFWGSISPFLMDNFEQVVYLWTQYDHASMEQLLNHFHPDIVIEERVERYLFLNSPGEK